MQHDSDSDASGGQVSEVTSYAHQVGLKIHHNIINLLTLLLLHLLRVAYQPLSLYQGAYKVSKLSILVYDIAALTAY